MTVPGAGSLGAVDLDAFTSMGVVVSEEGVDNPGNVPKKKRKRKPKADAVTPVVEPIGKAPSSAKAAKPGAATAAAKTSTKGKSDPEPVSVRKPKGSDKPKATAKAPTSKGAPSHEGSVASSASIDKKLKSLDSDSVSSYSPLTIGVGSRSQKGWSGDVISVTASTLNLSHVTHVYTDVNPKHSGVLKSIFPGVIIEAKHGPSPEYPAEAYPPEVAFVSYVLSNLLFDYLTRRYSTITGKEAHFVPADEAFMSKVTGARALGSVGCVRNCNWKWGDPENWRTDGRHSCTLWGGEFSLLLSAGPRPPADFAVWAMSALVYSPENTSACAVGCVNVVKKRLGWEKRSYEDEPLDSRFDSEGPVYLHDNQTGKTVVVERAFHESVEGYYIGVHVFSILPSDRDYSLESLEQLGPVYVEHDGGFERCSEGSFCKLLFRKCCGSTEDDNVYHHSKVFRDVHGVKRTITVEATSTMVSDMLSNTSYLPTNADVSVVANQMLNKAMNREKSILGTSHLPISIQSELTVGAGLAASIWNQQQSILHELAQPPKRRGCCYRFFYRSSGTDHVLSPTMVGMSRRKIILWRVYVVFILLAVAIGVGVYYGLYFTEGRRRLSTFETPNIEWAFLPLGAFMCAWFVKRRRKMTAERYVLPRVCVDASQHSDVNIKSLNRNLLSLRIDRDVLPALNAGDLGMLPCQPKSAPPCVQKGPASGMTTVGFHQCLRTSLHGVFGRALIRTANPDPKVMNDFFEFVRSVCFPEAATCLDAFRFDYEEWFDHLESARKREAAYHFDKFILGRGVQNKSSKVHVKIDEKHDMSEKLARPRVIVAAAPSRKPLEGPFFYALETCFDCYREGGHVFGINGYCGRKNWEELGADVTDAWLNILDPVFLCYDVSAFDASQHGEIMAVCDAEFYTMVMEHPYVANGLSGHFKSDVDDFQALARGIQTDAVLEGQINQEYRALVEWLIDGTVPSGRNNTTEGNTRRSCWYFRYAVHRAGLLPSQYRFWAKGDDLLAVVERSTVEALKSSLRDVFADSADSTKGLGMLLKRIEVGGVNDFDFLSARAFFNGSRFFLVRDPGRFLAMTPWTISLPKWECSRECFIIMRDLQWSEFNNISSWAGSMDLPLFMPYARLLLTYAKHTTVGHDKFRYRNENAYVVLSRTQTSGDPSDAIHFRRWLFDKFGVTAADLAAFESVINAEIARVEAGVGAWEYDGPYSAPVPMSPSQFANPVSRILVANTLEVERPTSVDVFPDKHLRDRAVRKLVEVELDDMV